MTDARQDILSRLRQGRDHAPFQKAVSPLPENAPVFSDDPDRDWQHVANVLTPIGGRLLLAQTPQEARDHLLQTLQQEQVQSAVQWRHPLLQELDVEGLLEEAGISRHQADTAPLCPQLAEVDAGITAVDALFALAGTIVIKAGARQARATSLVPPLHVALAPQSLLYNDLASLPGLMRQHLREHGRLPSAVHMITGSSSTADIEQTLVRPAHGPAAVRVIGLTWA